MKQISQRNAQGFTLLELIIAIAIFALLALATYQMLDSVLRTDTTTRAHEQRLRELSRGIWTFERDALQAIARPINDGFADPQPALRGEDESSVGAAAVEFTRSGWRNPTGQLRSQLQRVRWQLVGEQLQRVYWVVLDQAVDSQPRVQNVLSGVTELHFRYLDKKGQWHTEWPPLQSSEPVEKARTRLPQALELTLQHNHYGQLTRLLRLPDAPPEAQQDQGGDGSTPEAAPVEPAP